jgi:MYXO-CTERM domain-containing protein
MKRLLLALALACLAAPRAEALTINPADLSVLAPINAATTFHYRLTASPGSFINGSSLTAPDARWGFAFGDCEPGFIACDFTNTFNAPIGVGETSTAFNLFSECPLGGGACTTREFRFDAETISVMQRDAITLDFGDVPIGTTALLDMPISVDAGFFLVSLQISGGAAFGFDFGDCSGTGPYACTAQASFAPTDLGLVTTSHLLAACPIAGGGGCVLADYAVIANAIAEPAAIPAPASAAFVALGLFGLATMRRRENLPRFNSRHPATGSAREPSR